MAPASKNWRAVGLSRMWDSAQMAKDHIMGCRVT